MKIIDGSKYNIFQISFKSVYVNIFWSEEEHPVKKIEFSANRIQNNGVAGNPKVNVVADEIQRYLAGENVTFSINDLDLSGLSGFSRNVLKVLSSVKYGETITYKELAGKCKTNAVRALGSVLAKNRFLIAYPCHRVVKTSGEAGEYAAGREMKIKLLELENNGCKVNINKREK